MKKFVLIVAAALFTFVAGAVSYMHVKMFGDIVVEYDVEKVEKVDYEKDASNDTRYMRTTTTDGKIDKYDVEKVEEVNFHYITSDTTGTAVLGVSVSGVLDNYTYVDLGLPSGLKWATYNVGATKPTEYGDYFSWGETKPKKDYSWKYYKWCTVDEYGTWENFSKYGPTDNTLTLDLADDAAAVNWGGSWRMPTTEEQLELIENCFWMWTDDFNGSGIKGKVGLSKKNSNIIFLPAAGCYIDDDLCGGDGCYWSSSHHENSPNNAYYLGFGLSFGTTYYIKQKYNGRAMGFPVRAVSEITSTGKAGDNTVSGSEQGYDYVDLGLSVNWATYNVGAHSPTEYGNLYSWGELSPKSIYDWYNYKWYVDTDGNDIYKYIKYCDNSTYGIVDGKIELEIEDDAAANLWKGAWRMPTYEQMLELYENCDWEWTGNYKDKGIPGMIGTSKKNGNIIFFPAAGNGVSDYNPNLDNAGLYWTSTIYGDCKNANCFYFIKSHAEVTWDVREIGHSIRAIVEKK